MIRRAGVPLSSLTWLGTGAVEGLSCPVLSSLPVNTSIPSPTLCAQSIVVRRMVTRDEVFQWWHPCCISLLTPEGSLVPTLLRYKHLAKSFLLTQLLSEVVGCYYSCFCFYDPHLLDDLVALFLCFSDWLF